MASVAASESIPLVVVYKLHCSGFLCSRAQALGRDVWLQDLQRVGWVGAALGALEQAQQLRHTG